MYLQRKDLTWDYACRAYLEHYSSGIFALKKMKSICSVKTLKKFLWLKKCLHSQISMKLYLWHNNRLNFEKY